MQKGGPRLQPGENLNLECVLSLLINFGNLAAGVLLFFFP